MIYLVLLVLLVVPVLRFGYHFGDLDHVILSLRGIANASPQAFQNDWFVEKAPQPHWLFDLFTQWGESLGLLREFYFAYWIISTCIFCYAVLLICRHLNVGKYIFLIAILLALEPLHILGTIPLLGSWALPHFLGGALGLLACAFWLEKKELYLWLAVPLVTLVHTQHGALVSLLLIFGSAVQYKIQYRSIILGLSNLVVVFVTAKMRGLTEDRGLFLQLCKTFISGHCFAPQWDPQLLLPMAILLFMTAYYTWKLWKDRSNSWAALTLAASAIAFFGTLADYLDIPVMADLYRSYFMHRITGYAICFSVIAVIPIMSSKESSRTLLWGIRSSLIIALICLFIMPGSVFREESSLMESALSAPYLESLGHKMQLIIPPGETIVADPRLVWLRYVSRRAIVTDLKAFPYQADAFNEWQERFADLNGLNFPAMDFQKLLTTLKKYKSHFVILSRQDSKFSDAEKTFENLMGFGDYILFGVKEEVLSKN